MLYVCCTLVYTLHVRRQVCSRGFRITAGSAAVQRVSQREFWERVFAVVRNKLHLMWYGRDRLWWC